MITKFRIQNYKALRDVTLDLTPMHVLIGPNDSGKTSILEAIAAMCRSVDLPLSQAFLGSWTGYDLIWTRGANAELPVVLSANLLDRNESLEYEFGSRFAPKGKSAVLNHERIAGLPDGIFTFAGDANRMTTVCNFVNHPQAGSDVQQKAVRRIHSALSGVCVCRWMPRMLALPVAPDSNRRFRIEANGFGLALCLDDILGSDRVAFDRLESRFRMVFPQVRTIKLKPEPAFRSPVDEPELVPKLSASDGKGIYFELADGGRDISAAQVSDGMLLVLAYLTVLNLPNPPRVLLIEEPENGIHPGLLSQVISILRDCVREQTHTQVLMTTHSPYVVDSFEPKEVTLCRRDEANGTFVTRLSESAAVRDQLDVFTLGEIWTAEGDERLTESAAASKEAAS